MNGDFRLPGGASMLGRPPDSPPRPEGAQSTRHRFSSELSRALAEVKGQAQFILFLADQLDDATAQLSADEPEPSHAAFLAKILSMYSSQLESRHHGLGDRIAEVCQEIYIATREFDT